MFGEYNDLDICGINRGGGFDDPSDDTNYSFDAQSDASASISDDYIDTFGSESEAQNVNAQASQNSPVPEGAQSNSQSEVYQPKQSSGSVYMLALLLIIVTAVGLFFYNKNVKTSHAPANNQELGDYFYDKAVENGTEQPVTEDTMPQAEVQQNEAVATVDVNLEPAQQTNIIPQQPVAKEEGKTEPNPKFSTKSEKPVEKKRASVVIPVTSGGRLDPFCPFNNVQEKAASSKLPKFDIVAPPLDIPVEDPMINRLMEIKITGIMFDSVRPSAIIIVDGNEQLVHKGDLVCDYKILDITKDKVVMKYKTNTYEVSAGQVLTTDGVNLNPVSSSSLSKQFGGAYSSQPKNIINFN